MKTFNSSLLSLCAFSILSYPLAGLAQSKPPTAQPATAPAATAAQPVENAPLNISIAATPDEFRCEALHISDYDKVNESMEALKKTIHDTFGINDKCVTTNLSKPENQKNLNVLLENLNGGVSTIRGQLSNLYVEGLAQIATGSITSQQAYELSAQQQLKAKEAVKVVVGSMTELNAMIEKNPLNVNSSSNCTGYYSSTEKLVFGVAEMVENVSPLLIQAVSKIPSLQELAPAVLGVSMVSSAVTQYAQVAQKRVDVYNPENRTAILINTCQLVKTYNKMRMLRALKDNPLEEKKKLNTLILDQTKVLSSSSTATKQEAESSSDQRRWITVIDEQNQIYQSLLDMKDSAGSSEASTVCENKGQVLSMTEQVINIHRTISDLAGQRRSLQDEAFLEQIAKYKAAAEIENSTVESCARSSRALYEYLYAFNRSIFQNLMELKKERLARDNNVMKASVTLSFLRSFQSLLDQTNTNSLFEKLQASIGKTEALVNQSQVLKAWFGNAKSFYLPGIDTYRNPVMDLLQYYESQFLKFRGPFADTAKAFDGNLFLLYLYWHPVPPKEYDYVRFLEFQKSSRLTLDLLDPIHLDMKNVTTVTGRSSPHERACSGLVSMRDTYRSMIDSWSTLKYLCYMLKPLLNEPEVSSTLRAKCLGVDDMVPNSRRAKLSGIDRLLDPVSVEVARMPIVLRKIQELKCEN